MGGGEKTLFCSKCGIEELKCQICEQSSHIARSCPFINAECHMVGCKGLCKLLISGTEINPGRMYLKCSISKCGSFRWVDKLIDQKTSGSSYSVVKQHRAVGCFGCGEPDHWLNKCPWVGGPCMVHGCRGNRELKTSRWVGYEGEKYLSCTKCDETQWLKDAKKMKASVGSSSSSIPAQLVIQTTLEDLCTQLGKSSFK